MRDAAADSAIERVLADGLFRSLKKGWIWHQNQVGDLRALDEYARTSSRYDGYVRGERRTLLPFKNGPLSLRRAIHYEILQKL